MKLSTILAGAALFVVLGGSAVAAKGLIHAGDIATGAVTSRAIKNGAVDPRSRFSTRHLARGHRGKKRVHNPAVADSNPAPVGRVCEICRHITFPLPRNS